MWFANLPSKRWWYTLGVLSLLLLLVVRMVDVQVVRGEFFASLADNNRFYELPIEAMRGLLYSRYDTPLTLNNKRYFLLESADALYTAKEPITVERARRHIATASGAVSTEYFRTYPFAEGTAHVTGYVGAITSEELKTYPHWPLQKQIGKAGLELVFNDQLKGRDGKTVFEINALGERQRLMYTEPSIPGEDVHTSIDPYLSEVAYQALGGQKGSVIISDAYSGQTLALVNSPSYDPTLFSEIFFDPTQERQRRNQVQELFQDEAQPFFNRAIAGSYPPGSTFKLITALSALELGKIDETTTVIDEGSLKVGEYEYGNWYFRQYGRTEGEIGLVRSIARSNDIFFYKAAEWVGPAKLAEMAEMFGLGAAPQLELRPLAAGVVPTPAWKERVIGEPWYLGNTYHFGIGQGDVLVSPLQIQHMTQALANQGELCESTLLEHKQTACTQVGLQEQHIQLVIQGMIEACSPSGTAFPFFARNDTVIANRGQDAGPYSLLKHGAVACKTGTAEFGPADEQGYRATHAWFTMMVEPQLQPLDAVEDSSEPEAASESAEVAPEIVPADSKYQQWRQLVDAHGFPERIVMTVLVESDDEQKFKEGSREAGPVAKSILDWMEEGKDITLSVSPDVSNE